MNLGKRSADCRVDFVQFMHYFKAMLEMGAEISADMNLSLSPVVKRNILSFTGISRAMVCPYLSAKHGHPLAFWAERHTCWASWTDGNSPVLGFKAGIDSTAWIHTHHQNTKWNNQTSLLLSAPRSVLKNNCIRAHPCPKGTHSDLFVTHMKPGDDVFIPMDLLPPPPSLNPLAWVIVGPCEIIVAFNANGSPTHSLFSPGNRVLQRVEGPMSYCSAWTNLRLQGKWQRPAALSPLLSPSLHVSSVSLCLSARSDGHHAERLRLCHSCGVVKWLLMVLLWTEWQTAGFSCVTAEFDHGQLRLL